MEIRRYFGNLHQVSPVTPPAVIVAYGELVFDLRIFNDFAYIYNYDCSFSAEMLEDNQRRDMNLAGEAVRDQTQ